MKIKIDMRRKVRIKPVTIQVGPSFFRMLENRRKVLQKQIGFKKNITQIAHTEMLARSGKLKFPKLNLKQPVGGLKNVKRKKS